jgi:lathosterol oxidase
MQHVFEPFVKIFSFSAIRYFVFAGAPFLIYYIWFDKQVSAAKIQDRSSSRRDFVREIFHSMQTTVVFAIIGCRILNTPVKNITRIYTGFDAYPLWWLFTSVVLSLVIHDTYFYWMHRLLHHPKIFRHAHLVHHQSTVPSPWTSYSFHILEAIAEGMVLLVITMILPMNILSITLFVIIGFVINVYGHLGYEIAPKWLRNTFLFNISNTSVHHNMHHSKFNANYGLYFRFWDKVMDTEHPDYIKEYDRIQQNRINKIKCDLARP